MRVRHALFALLTATAPVAAGAADLPKADAVKPVEVLRTGDYSEGVVVDHAGVVHDLGNANHARELQERVMAVRMPAK